MIRWTRNKETMELESKIAERAVAKAKEMGVDYDKISATMDIDACHSNGNPLKLADLLKADNFNFVHDVFGIRQNIDRTTGKLLNCFSPRYSM